MASNLKIKMVLLTEFLGFSLVILILWANEVLDIPHEFLGSPPTPVNWEEALLESVLVFLLGLYVMFVSWFVFVGIESQSSKQKICPVCKRIKTGNTWSVFPDEGKASEQPHMEQSLCPECFDKVIKHL